MRQQRQRQQQHQQHQHHHHHHRRHHHHHHQQQQQRQQQQQQQQQTRNQRFKKTTKTYEKTTFENKTLGLRNIKVSSKLEDAGEQFTNINVLALGWTMDVDGWVRWCLGVQLTEPGVDMTNIRFYVFKRKNGKVKVKKKGSWFSAIEVTNWKMKRSIVWGMKLNKCEWNHHFAVFCLRVCWSQQGGRQCPFHFLVGTRYQAMLVDN